MRTLAEIEQLYQREFDAMPVSFQDEHATEFYVFINVIRQARFNVPCVECEECGYSFPRDDVSLVRKSDGREYWECVECIRFGSLVRALFKDAA